MVSDEARTNHRREPATATTEEELLLPFEQLITGLATSMGEHAVPPAGCAAVAVGAERLRAIPRYQYSPASVRVAGD